MSKYQFGAFLLIVAGVQLVLAVKVARLSKRKSSEQSTKLQVEIDRLDKLSKRVQVVCLGAVLVFVHWILFLMSHVSCGPAKADHHDAEFGGGFCPMLTAFRGPDSRGMEVPVPSQTGAATLARLSVRYDSGSVR